MDNQYTGILLVSLSALFHAVWNTIFKKEEKHSIEFLVYMLLVSSILYLPLAIRYFGNYIMFPWQTWIALLISGVAQTIYYITLSLSYSKGELSRNYPLSRSVAVILIMIFTAVFRIGKSLQLIQILIILIVILGCFLLVLQSSGNKIIIRRDGRSFIYALTAAAGIAGYTIADSLGMSFALAEAGPMRKGITISFGSMEVFTALVMMSVFSIIFSKGNIKGYTKNLDKKTFLNILFIGIFMPAGYFLILYAYRYFINISFVSGFRLLSLPLGTVLSVIVLKEKLTPAKITGTILIISGLTVLTFLR